MLLALFAYLAHKDRGGWMGWVGPVAYLLACLCKEPGAALILVLGAVEAAEWRREGSLGAALRRGAARLAPYVAVVAVYLALRLHALGSFSPRSYGVTASPAGAVAFAAGLLARYLAFLVVPFPARVLTSVPAPAAPLAHRDRRPGGGGDRAAWGWRRRPGAAGRGGRSSCRWP